MRPSILKFPAFLVALFVLSQFSGQSFAGQNFVWEKPQSYVCTPTAHEYFGSPAQFVVNITPSKARGKNRVLFQVGTAEVLLEHSHYATLENTLTEANFRLLPLNLPDQELFLFYSTTMPLASGKIDVSILECEEN